MTGAEVTTLDYAPDFMEPIVGWRVWKIHTETGLPASMLLFAKGPWKGGKAGCNVVRDMEEKLQLPKRLARAEDWYHEAPCEECECGWYAWKKREDAERQSQTPCACLIGQVALWGKIIEHEFGYRAEYAKPLSFWAEPRVEISRIEAHWGLPVGRVTVKRTMMGGISRLVSIYQPERFKYADW